MDDAFMRRGTNGRALLALVAAGALAGCIAADGRSGAPDTTTATTTSPPADTGGGTTDDDVATVTSDPSDGSATIVPDDVVTVTSVEPDATSGGDAERDSDDDGSTQECQGPSDCGLAPQCTKWLCVDNRCVPSPKAGTCDDGDRCTGDGTCDDGVCQPGAPLVCDVVSACGRPTCDPQVGCLDTIVTDGFCVADPAGSGQAWGTCDGVRMAPPDRCAADGLCVEQATGANTPLPKGLVAGKWFIVGQTGTASSIAGQFVMGEGGTWTAGTLLTPGGPFDPALLDDQTWCMDAQGGVAANIGPNHLVGQVDPAGEALGLSGTLGHEVFVGVRPTGTIASVDGTYAAVLTANYQDQLVVFSGTMVFETGCLEDDAPFQTGDPDIEPFTVLGDGCLTPTDNGLVTLPTELETFVTPSVTNVTQLGAIGPRGDTVLMVRLASDDSIAPGMLVLTRLSTAAQAITEGRTEWTYALQEPTPDGPIGEVVAMRGFAGLLQVEDSVILNGRHALGQQVLGERFVVDGYGRLLVALRTFFTRAAWSGYLAPSGGFGVFYEVEAPTDWSGPFILSETPIGPTFGVMIRRARAQ